MSNLDEMKEQFFKLYKQEPTLYIDTGGRFEICGNHTDHNHGLCLVANCSLRIRAVVNKNSNLVRVLSKGYKYFEFDINDLTYKATDYPATMAIARGILFKLKELGYKIGGFDAYIISDIPDGSGVSSSAAIESLFGYIISYLYNDKKISPLTIAKVGQFSENNYFKKPSGLLDQIGTSYDSSNFIDFKNIDNPIINTLPFDLPLTLYLIKSEGDHSNLTPLYSAIPSSMYEVANLLDGKHFLRDCNEKNIENRIDALNVNDEIKRKAKHFFIENKNVLKAKKAIEENNVEDFLSAIRASQESSKNNLENTFVKGEFVGSPQEIIDNVTSFINNHGAIRIHGGGFKGTVLAFIKNDFTNEFDSYLEKKYKGKYYKVVISNKAVNSIAL